MAKSENKKILKVEILQYPAINVDGWPYIFFIINKYIYIYAQFFQFLLYYYSCFQQEFVRSKIFPLLSFNSEKPFTIKFLEHFFSLKHILPRTQFKIILLIFLLNLSENLAIAYEVRGAMIYAPVEFCVRYYKKIYK